MNGPFPSAGAEVCGNNTCEIDYELGSFVHWSVYPGSEPLLTEAVFINSAAHATCITTFCNTALFDASYRQTETSCPYTPCPTNSLDSNCNIVVGTIGLPEGGVTSV